MGADMNVACLYWDRKRKLNWKAGIKAIKALKYEPDNNGVPVVTSDVGIDYQKKTLLGYLNNLKDYNVRRDVATLDFAHLYILITGGMTSGDDPTDLYTAINALEEADYNILRAVGFNHPEDDTDYKQILMKVLKIKTAVPMLMGLDPDLDRLIGKEMKK